MDPSSDYHFLHHVLGKTVQITLKCGTFQGILQHVDSSQCIFLNRVKNLESGRNVPGVKKFFGHEIVNVQLLDDLEQCAAERNTTPAGSREFLSTKLSAVDQGSPLKQSTHRAKVASPVRQHLCLGNVKFPDENKGEDIEYIVIDQFQKKFGSAMMHIKKQSVCSIAAEGVNLCRYGKLAWLQIATKSQVFLFDIFLLGARVFKNGLQMILEDQNILKVIHDCRWLSDCLSHQYGIVLSNVFDTQVADVLQFSMETGGYLPHRISSLQECLIRYLGLPYKCISFLEYRQQAVVKNPEVWFVRPLPPVLMNVLALETVYLLPLRLLLLDEIMSDLTTLVDGYLNAFRQGSADPLGSIEISSMELPEELRQLADVYNIRRKTAVQKFQLSEEGFLIRKQVEPIRRKMAAKEAYPKTFCPRSVHLWLPGSQGSYEKEEIYHHDNQEPTIGSGEIESKMETKGGISCKLTLEETKM
ncbi:piRNA biogenesis protein EXD1 isoform X1 [Python bivittatus]|uniref:PiRNA biogenesis protein EXD1 isoform X1 n=1 Tax=Python bivittatus TaxID=176946 RepID=A0A9F5IVG8_PYTBI|nr:piRNA biogenesis protein EXD1 isoform X1 [Python bivittatus]XP_025024402.1 piRNA biogenesis protein EXD1 isoform X1 [Python bivittatus]XP_025024403.1 piRNA biogenesis protein EXD1 isoform X1 [Python bivittatus]